MFNETHRYSNNGPMLAFVKSTNIQAYPCGRRSAAINNGDTFIPFDPESRLNTEANIRKNSSLNGFTQTYVKEWNSTNALLSLVLAGYIFDIKLESGYKTYTDFANNLKQKLVGEADISRIYANIFLEEAKLYQDTENTNLTYATLVLRNQSKSNDGKEAWGETSIDLPINTNNNNSTVITEYYFSGLSFSTVPLTNTAALITRDISYEEGRVENEARKRQWVSLCILEKKDGIWDIHQPALLPKIEHGDTEGSIKLFGNIDATGKLEITDDIKAGGTIVADGDIETKGGLVFSGNDASNITGVKNITATGDISTASLSTSELKYDGIPLHKLVTDKIGDDENGNEIYQLKFISTTKENNISKSSN